jgi:hypothetical protein
MNVLMTPNFASLLETVSIRVPTPNIHIFTMFRCSSSHFPLATLLLMQFANLELFLQTRV